MLEFNKYNNVKRCYSIDILKNDRVRVMTEYFGFSFANQVKRERHQQPKYTVINRHRHTKYKLNRNTQVNILYTFFIAAGLE